MPNDPTASVSQHDVPGGVEYDVAITVPTPAGQVHPDTLVVPPGDDGNSVPTPAGVIADTHGPDTLVVTPAGPDVPATVLAGTVNSGTSVARVDDPDKTLVPAGDLPSGVEVHNPDPAAPPVPGTGPVTAAELAAKLPPHDGEAATSADCQLIIDELAAAGFGLVRL